MDILFKSTESNFGWKVKVSGRNHLFKCSYDMRALCMRLFGEPYLENREVLEFKLQTSSADEAPTQNKSGDSLQSTI